MRNYRVAGTAIAALAGFFCVAPAFGVGVLLIDTKDGNHIMVWDAASGAEALNKAINAKKEDCESCFLHGIFRNSCAAYALDMDSANFRDSPINAKWVNYGYAVGLDSEASARSEALAICRKMNIRADQRTRNCVVVDARCDTTPEAGADSPDTEDSIQSLQSEVLAMWQEMEEAARRARAGSRDTEDSIQSLQAELQSILQDLDELPGQDPVVQRIMVDLIVQKADLIVQKLVEAEEPSQSWRQAMLQGVDVIQSLQAALQATRQELAGSAGAGTDAPPPGSVFRDCANCPEMVVIPAGSFRMGCLSGQGGHPCVDWELPVHSVTIPQAFAVSAHEVTFAEWDACARGGGCSGYRPDDFDWGRGRLPVINVSWNDAKAYASWLSSQTDQQYRLLSEAEWEYAARAGTSTKYSWGNDIGINRANCHWGYTPMTGNEDLWVEGSGCKDRYRDSSSVGSFDANAFGLYDMHGNVSEWVEDCWNESYAGAPSDGSARLQGDCSTRVVRGGSSWDRPSRPQQQASSRLRSAGRGRMSADFRESFNGPYGFRVARTLIP